MSDTQAYSLGTRIARLRVRLNHLYYGASPEAVRFRLAVIGVDLALIAFFVAAPFLRSTPAFLVVDYLVALILAVDLTARALAARKAGQWIRRPMVWLDLFVLVTLLFPLWLFNLAFLRVLRIWTLFNSEFFWSTVGRRFDDTRWEEVIRTLSGLVTFVFVATGFVYTSFIGRGAGITGYIDALYFTVSSLTTTGYGDITLTGPWGKVLSVAIMLSGIAFFARIATSLFRPGKVSFRCPTCGLLRHDPDAVHCKACGTLLNIPNDE
ncbi:MAG: ion channel [Phenylobacterium sp.]|uniref:ion channel n=1 Tax=Phenylobacterium sp. TaxID=1871053 RepID=UPI002A36D22D|nr:ion channel [Phenylobacterium sp.]MDX9999153.1 ion channel [Phenylobacterium sp.]